MLYDEVNTIRHSGSCRTLELACCNIVTTSYWRIDSSQHQIVLGRNLCTNANFERKIMGEMFYVVNFMFILKTHLKGLWNNIETGMS